jgi:hypothetical protein
VPRSQQLIDYYGDPWVRHRIREYCGDEPTQPTCLYLSAIKGSGETWDRAPHVPVETLDDLLAEGADVARSLWDRSNLLIHLDIDYQSIDVRDEAYRHPVEMFRKVEPVYRATTSVLHQLGLPLLALITGRGYHFTGRVPLESDVVDRLASTAPETPTWIASLPARRPSWITADISPRHARAYLAVGMIAEFLAHRILRRARRRAAIPIVLNGTVVGSGLVGRECVSIDVSYAGDPLDARHVRVAFGSYQKHTLTSGAAGTEEFAPFAAVPRDRESLPELLSRQRDLAHAARAARRRAAAIPLVNGGVHRVLDAYESSALARFHRTFYATSTDGPDQFDALVQSPQWRSLPECVVGPLLDPNDRLLQPAVIQHVIRALMAQGLRPRDIAGVLHSRYAADFNWGPRWRVLDARTRAEFEVRVFAGLHMTGLDDALDFNCRSAQEKELCPMKPCGWDLRVTRQQLLEGRWP